MNTYHRNLIAYFAEHGESFIGWLASQKTTSTVLAPDFTALALAFLNEEIRKEMTQYDHRCRRYHLLIDMLIESHAGNQNTDFREALHHGAHMLFLKDKVSF